jgi:DNA repair protein RecO
MAHHTYHTDGFVLGGYNTGESHRYLSVFTLKLGLVYAVARSGRSEKSKLRYSLQEFSKVRVSLVRGHNVWRITGAEEYFNIYYHLVPDLEKQALISRMHLLLRRLLQGEESNAYLFTTLDTLYTTLRTGVLSQEKLSSIECVSVLRILYSLGYVKYDKEFSPFFSDTSITEEVLEHAHLIKRHAIAEINQSLEASHL